MRAVEMRKQSHSHGAGQLNLARVIGAAHDGLVVLEALQHVREPSADDLEALCLVADIATKRLRDMISRLALCVFIGTDASSDGGVVRMGHSTMESMMSSSAAVDGRGAAGMPGTPATAGTPGTAAAMSAPPSPPSTPPCPKRGGQRLRVLQALQRLPECRRHPAARAAA